MPLITARPVCFATLVALAVAPGSSAAQTARQYDSSGRSTGCTEGQATQRHDDSAGRSQGRSERRGDTLRHYDSSGRSMGRTEWSGDHARLYGSVGPQHGAHRAQPEQPAPL